MEYAVRFTCGFVFFGILGLAFFLNSDAVIVPAVIAGAVGGVLACLFGDRLWNWAAKVLRYWWP
jgi:hypothetical protein